MANELIVNVTLGETRIARLENGVVAELYVERTRDIGIVGNIYKGRVVRVLPGMQAAFVELGLERTGFLHVSDILPPELANGPTKLPAVAREEEEGGDGQEAEEDDADELRIPKRRHARDVTIQSLLKEGRDILVQVTKEPMGTKGSRLSSYISLPGRYLVYMPTVDHIGVSRRIDDERERRRLREIVGESRPAGAGFIVRTASEGVSQKELKADITYLTKTWDEINAKAPTVKAPALVHAELDVVLRVVRDLFTEDIDRLVIDSASEHERIRQFCDTFMPQLRNQLEVYKDAEPIFDHFGIEVEITRALGQKVWLKSGGYIIIEQTEALTAIDVNTGRFVGRHNVEDTILKTNLEAVKEIVYQLRLRNIGGIIILDFIDMDRHANRNKVYNALKEALKGDRAKTNITKISELGLVEMTRKRTREDLRRVLTDPCPYCEGKGYLKSPQTVCYEIFREIYREARHYKGKQIKVLAHPNVANIFYNEERRALEETETKLKRRVAIQTMPDFHLEQFEVIEK